MVQNSLSVTDNRTGKTYTVPISSENSIDATAFRAMTFEGKDERKENETANGLRVFDPGYQNTAVTKSSITYIDGDNGILRYRGYPIEQIAAESNFMETAYLLIYGELPTKDQYENFESEVMHHTYAHESLAKILQNFRHDSHPMAILTSSFAALGAFAPEANPALQGQTIYTKGATNDKEALALMDKQIYRLIGKSITLAAMSYRVRQGRPFNRPPHSLSFAGTFLYMLDHLNQTDYKPHPVFEKALDKLFILHADHEMNCSTAAAMQVGSSLADPYSVISAANSALYGPLHGGANEAVIRMLEKIGSPDNVPEFLEKVKRREAVLSGFGHRIYKTTDPRSNVVREIADEVFAITGSEPMLETALKLRDMALKDEYFIKRKLAPNVDFFTGLIYRQMGFPTDMFPVLFSVPRVVGWIAHWRQQMLNAGGVKIWRPRQLYVGAGERDYRPMSDRADKSAGDPKKQPQPVSHHTSSRASLGSYQEKGRPRANKL